MPLSSTQLWRDGGAGGFLGAGGRCWGVLGAGGGAGGWREVLRWVEGGGVRQQATAMKGSSCQPPQPPLHIGEGHSQTPC